MAGSIELASTVLSVGISTQSLGRDLASTIKSLGGQVSGVGRKAGADFKSGFDRSSAGAGKAAVADQEKLRRAVMDSAKAIKSARESESDATRKVAIEERKLNELRESGKAKASQLLAAEDRLVKAQRAAAIATDKVAGNVREYRKAHDDLQKELTQTAQKTDAASKSAGGFGSKLKAKLGNPFSGLSRQASDAGTKSATGFSSKMSAGVKRGLPKMGGMLKAGLAGLAVGAGAGVAAAFTEGIGKAGNLQQSKGAVEAIFKGQAGGILAASKGAATSLGLTENAYNELASSLGSGLKNKGIKTFAGDTQNLIGLGADLAAQFGGSTADAVAAIGSLMRGESDPIERFGVSINETAIKAELAAKGQSKLTGAALEQAKAQARLSILFRQTADAQGTFARESDTLQGKQARFGAQWENLTTKLMEGLLPAFTSVFGWLSDKGIPALEGFFSVLQGKGETPAWLTGIQAWAAQFRPGIEGIKSAFIGLWQKIQPILMQVWEALMQKWAEIGPSVTATFEGIGKTIGDVMTVIQVVVQGATGFLSFIWGKVGKNIVGIVTGFMGTVAGVFRGISNVIGGIWQVLSGLLTGNWRKALDGLVRIANGFWGTIKSVFGGIANTIVNVLGGIWELVKAPFEAGWKWITDGFAALVKGIGDVWSGIKAAFSAPVKWLADTVVNPLLGAVRTVLNAVGLSGLADKLPNWDFQGFADGGWTGPGGKYQIAGVVHADEFVINKAARRKFAREHPGALEYLNNYGSLPGYATGGTVRPVPGPWTTYPGHRGIDFPVSSGTPIRSWAMGRVRNIIPMHYSWGNYMQVDHGGGLWSAYAHMSRFLAQMGQVLAAGQILGKVGSTGNSTGPHLHWEIWRNGTRVFPGDYLDGSKTMGTGVTKAPESSGGSFAADLIKSAVSGFLGKDSPSGGIWGEALSAIPALIVGGIAKTVTGGYASGTSYAAPGYAWVGEQGPEIVRFRGGEQVYTAAQSAAMSGPITLRFVDADGVLLGTMRGEVDRAMSGSDGRVRALMGAL